ncbi:hypothetical protein P4U97_18190 [Bacillus swezeyi]|nr:hypothetical protein [Bacillus swezeyi]MED1741407.1 hypothetical protein [Bacillus swezeyi]
MTEQIRNVGNKTINDRIKKLPEAVTNGVREQMNELINELKGEA